MPRETEPVFFRLDADLKAKLEQVAQDEDLKLAQLLRRIRSLRFDAREFDHLRPLCGLIADEFAEISRRAGNYHTA